MPRNPEHQTFLDVLAGRIQDTLPKDEEIPATKQEIGWWKQYQVRRMIGYARAGRATYEELEFLARHGHFYPTTPKELRILYAPRNS